MADYITNIILMHACDRDKLINAYNQVDFPLIIPIPDSLRQDLGGGIAAAAMEYYRGKAGYDDIRPYIQHLGEDEEERLIGGEDSHGRYLKDGAVAVFQRTLRIDGRKYLIESAGQFRELGRIYVENQERYGSLTWLDWASKTWGTMPWSLPETDIYEIGDYLLVVFETEDGTLSGEFLGEMERQFEKPFLFECVGESEIGEAAVDSEAYGGYAIEELELFHVEEHEEGRFCCMPNTELTEEQARDLLERKQAPLG